MLPDLDGRVKRRATERSECARHRQLSESSPQGELAAQRVSNGSPESGFGASQVIRSHSLRMPSTRSAVTTAATPWTAHSASLQKPQATPSKRTNKTLG